MRRLHLLKTAGLLAAVVVGLATFRSTDARAQRTTYGQDPVPNSSEAYEPWGGYGTDPVPHNRFSEHGYIRAYGFDQVPGTPRQNPPATYRQPIERVVPNQTEQVLTSDVEGTDAKCRSETP